MDLIGLDAGADSPAKAASSRPKSRDHKYLLPHDSLYTRGLASASTAGVDSALEKLNSVNRAFALQNANLEKTQCQM